MSSFQSCSLSQVENVSAPYDHGVIEVLAPPYYPPPLSFSESFGFEFPGSYLQRSEETTMPQLSSFFAPELGALPTTPQNSASRTLQNCLQINTSQPHDDRIPNRPHSSPSNFPPIDGLEVEWPVELGQAPRSDGEESPYSLPQPVTPVPIPTPTPIPRRHRQSSSISSLPDFQNQTLRRQFTPILPNPAGLQQLKAQKRAASEDEWEPVVGKRKRSIPPSPQVEMTEEDTLLLHLKDDENLSWKEIATRFQSEMGKQFHVPALQMRLKRLRERMRMWTENDIHALKMAHDYWISQKFEIIAAKIAEYGATEKWTSKQCSRKWAELSSTGDNFYNSGPRTSPFPTSCTSSPIEGPTQRVTAPFPPTSTPLP